MEEYRKSYKGLILWLVTFLIVSIGLPFTPWENTKNFLLLLYNMMNIWIFLLVVIIYKTEQIYWYSGMTFEKAKQAGSEARRRYAWEHVVRFGKLTGRCILFSIVSIFFHLHWGIDFAIETVGVVVTAISTIWIKLE